MKLWKLLRKLRKDKKAITGMTIALVVLLITVAVIIPIGILVTTEIRDAIPNITDTAANESAEDVFDNAYTAFGLSALVPIVAAAGLIISIIVGAFAFRRA